MEVFMRYSKAVAALAIPLLLAGCQTGQNEDTAKIMAELQAVKKRIDGIDVELKKVVKAKASLDVNSFVEKKADQAALEKIKLPLTPSRDEIKDYIRKIQLASKGQNSYSQDDPQVNMFSLVGDKNSDLLLESIAFESGRMGSYHIAHAINKMRVPPEFKDLLIKAFRRNNDLIFAIIRNGWEKDAKAAIMDLLKDSKNVNYRPPEVIQTAASYGDPEMNKALLDYFVYGHNRAQTYQILKSTPGICVDEKIIDRAWDQTLSSSAHEYEQCGMAVIAIEYGHKSALETLLQRVPALVLGNDYNFKCDSAVRKSVDCNGSIAEIKKWYYANRDNIVFDKTDKKFKIRKTENAAVSSTAENTVKTDKK